MSREEIETNKQIIRSLFAAADRRDWSAFDQLVSKSYYDHNPPPLPEFSQGLAGMRALSELVARALPDTRHTLDDLVAEGDLVAARVTATGRHTGELFGLQPTGVVVTKTGLAIYRIENGKVIERWGASGTDFLSQIRAASGQVP